MAIDINIPSQVKNYTNLAAFPASGALKTIYIANDTNKTYRWTGSAYVEISGTDTSSLVPTSRTLTINGTTQDLSADRTFTISTGITIGTTAITSGTVGRVLFEGTGNVVSESANLFWDNTNGRLGIGTSSPASKVDILQVADNTSPTLLRLNNTGSGASTGATLEFPFGAFIRSSYASMILSDRSGATVTLQGTSLTTTASSFSLAGAGIITFTGGSGTDGMIRTGGTITFNTFSGGYRDVGKFFQTGNFLIQTGGTFTDAGFKLDVNGTARVQNELNVGHTSASAGTLDVRTTTNAVTQYIQQTKALSTNYGLIVQAQASATGGTSIGGYFNAQYNTNNIALRTENGSVFLNASSGNTLIGTTTDVASSKLTIQSTTQGFLPPRMTTTQKNAIASPATGLMVYDTTLNLMSVYNGTTWITL